MSENSDTSENSSKVENGARSEQIAPGEQTKNSARSREIERVEPQHIGILGGGQLGMLLARSLHTLGAEAIIYDPDPQAPACQEATHSFTGSFTDSANLSRFFDRCKAVTYEFENVESDALLQFEREKPIWPGVNVLQTTQDRYLEKRFLKEHRLPQAAFELIEDPLELPEKVRQLGYPCVLKTTRGGYDGKGQWFVKDSDDVSAHLKMVEERKADAAKSDHKPGSARPYRTVLEEALAIEMEASVIAARFADGSETVFPVFENMHKNHILDFTIFPARLPETVATAMKELGLQAARQLSVIGLLTTEFFLTRVKPRRSNYLAVDGWYILINEFAPRPHNSGHVTIESCTLSQFDVLAHVLLQRPLAEPITAKPGAYCMGNLLGDVYLAQGKSELDLSCRKDHPNVVDVILYGKKEARAGRKMGHFVTRAETQDEALDCAKAFREALAASTSATSKVELDCK